MKQTCAFCQVCERSSFHPFSKIVDSHENEAKPVRYFRIDHANASIPHTKKAKGWLYCAMSRCLVDFVT